MKRTVYVLQENAESLDLICGLIADDFEVVGASCRGDVALKEIADLKPDVLLTELICANVDGLAVLEEIKAQNLSVKPVVLSYITNRSAIGKAVGLGALYYLTKPTEKSVLVSRLKDAAQAEDGSAIRPTALDEKISKIFISVGIPPHIKGYAYLREGVKMAVKTPEIINSITKKLYPDIGEKYSTTASKVERAMRHAIEVAWNRGRTDSINTVFGVRAYVGSEKPTNGEFIALVADKMILEGAQSLVQ